MGAAPRPSHFGVEPMCLEGHGRGRTDLIMDSYLPIFVLMVLGVVFAGVSFVASSLLAPQKRPTAQKSAPYECGIVPNLEPVQRFPVRFYLVAMIFIIFDIEVVFLYPWAAVLNQLGTFGLVEVLAFGAAVFISFLYLLANGALDWGPSRRMMDLLGRNTRESTVLRLGHRAVGPSSSRPGDGAPEEVA